MKAGGITSGELKSKLMDTYVQSDRLLRKKLEKSFEILENREHLKLKMKLCFFRIILILLSVLVFLPLIIMCVFRNNLNNIDVVVALISSIIEMTTGIIILPKIIAEYLFDKKEDNLYFELIKDLKNYHDNKRNYFDN